MTARVSVIVPTYNRADLIGLTLRSVLAQSVAPVEIIVVDDGSRDNTAEVVATFGDAVRYVTQPNAGVAAARNHGARLAAGDYLAFTDSDDLWHPLKLEAQLAAVGATPAAQWSVTGCDVIDTAGKPWPGRTASCRLRKRASASRSRKPATSRKRSIQRMGWRGLQRPSKASARCTTGRTV